MNYVINFWRDDLYEIVVHIMKLQFSKEKWKCIYLL